MSITYPDNLPCPRVSEVQAKERRHLSPQAGVDGPMRTRVLQRDLLQREQAAFIFTFEQAEVFRAWWQDVLIFGGCWFGAHWPLPQAVPDGGYRFRRFVGAPTWADFIPGVGWGVTAVFEVRGLGTPQVIDGGSGPLFLDEFSGPDGISISARAPDRQFNGSVWTAAGPVNPTEVTTMGNGTATAVGGAEAYTYFNNFDANPAPDFAWGWRVEATLLTPEPNEGDRRARIYIAGQVDGLQLSITVNHVTNVVTTDIGGTSQMTEIAPAEVLDVLAVMNEADCVVEVNGAEVSRHNGASFSAVSRMQILFVEPYPMRSPRIERLAFYGTPL